jgi:hypothetical protein
MRHRHLITLALASLLALPVAASAQTLKPGIWTGTVAPPGEGVVAVTFDVKVAGDTTSITLTAGEHGTFKLEEVKVTADKITFKFTPGPVVSCTLAKKDDGSYAGDCSDGGESAQMTMIPPKTEDELTD